jgi:flagellum-specific peptidoglycan hydrolase FlgJ
MESPALTTTSWNVWTDKELAPALPEAVLQAATQTPEIIPGVQPENIDRQQAMGSVGHIATQQTVSAEIAGTLAVAPEQSISKPNRPANLEDVITGEIAARPKTLEDMLPRGTAVVPPESRMKPDPESQRVNANDSTMTLQAISTEREKQGTIYGYTERYSYRGKHSQENATSVRKRRVALLAVATVTTAVLGGSMHTSVNGPGQGSKVEVLGNSSDGDAAKDGRMNTLTVTTGGEPIMGVSSRQEKIINSIPDLDKAKRDALKRFTIGVHKVTKDLDGVNPNVMLAQAVHESNFGSTGSARVDKNLFGMKGSYKGNSGTWMTWEEYGGVAKHIRAKFKKYPDEAASMEDYIDQAHRLKQHYGDAVAAPKGKSFREDGDYLDHILDHDQPNEAAYATDSKYKGKILKTIKLLHIRELTKIDKTPVRQVGVTTDSGATLSKLASIKQKIKEYALPKYHKAGSPGATEPTTAYKAAIAAAEKRDDEYIGDYNGVDCGVFVTRVMRDSGADPNYNDKGGNTYVQKQYLETHDDVKPAPGEQVLYHQVRDGEKLRPGDIAIESNGPGTVGHTFFYVGNSLDTKNRDFKGVLASASLRSRAPMASNDYRRSAYDWFRLIEK